MKKLYIIALISVFLTAPKSFSMKKEWYTQYNVLNKIKLLLDAENAYLVNDFVQTLPHKDMAGNTVISSCALREKGTDYCIGNKILRINEDGKRTEEFYLSDRLKQTVEDLTRKENNQSNGSMWKRIFSDSK